MEIEIKKTEEYTVSISEMEVQDLIREHVRAQVAEAADMPKHMLKVRFTASCQDDLNNVEVTWEKWEGQ